MTQLNFGEGDDIGGYQIVGLAAIVCECFRLVEGFGSIIEYSVYLVAWLEEPTLQLLSHLIINCRDWLREARCSSVNSDPFQGLLRSRLECNLDFRSESRATASMKYVFWRVLLDLADI